MFVYIHNGILFSFKMDVAKWMKPEDTFLSETGLTWNEKCYTLLLITRCQMFP